MRSGSDQPGLTRDQFIRNLEESGLSNLRELKPASGSDVDALAEELVDGGKLTRYQVDAILNRRFDDLVMGNYEILDKLGAGGMGAVYKARHRRMKRLVALKVLSREVAHTDTFLQRFQREVETIARLTHPNVVMAFDADEAKAGPFLVMEFVDGRDLASEVAGIGPLSVVDAVGCILQAARGLEYAHTQGIVHRDIKPANLMRDASGVVKVADLGLARLHESSNQSLTQAGGIVGTVDYMPPEQALDSTAIDYRADIYSLGCSLYFLLAGKPLYEGSTMMAVLLKHREAPIPSLAAVRPDVVPELDAFFQMMVAKKPEDRPAAMSQVVGALDELKRAHSLSDVRPVGPSQKSGTDTDLNGPTINLSSGDASAARSPSSGLSAAAPEADTARKIAGRRLVVAEGSRTQAGIVRRFLQQLGIADVHVAGGGREALELAKREQADAILASMHLPDMNGLDLALLLLAEPATSRIGLVLATSEADVSEAAFLLPPSARVAIVGKPFDAERLANAIAATLTAPGPRG